MQMPRLISIGLCIWLVVAISAFALSGDVYFSLENVWITAIPLFSFLVVWILYFFVRKGRCGQVIGDNLLAAIRLAQFSKLVRILNYITLLVSLIMLLLMYYINETLGISVLEAQDLRSAFFGNLADLGGVFFIWFIWAFVSIVNALLLIGIIVDITRKKPFSITSIGALVNIALWSLITGGRMAFFSAMIFYMGAWFLCAKEIHLLNKRLLNWLLWGGIVFIIPLVFQQINRTAGIDKDVGNVTVIKYFVGPIFALDQMIETGTTEVIYAEVGRPGNSLLGLDTLLVSGFLRGVLGLPIESALSATSYYFHFGIPIAPNIQMNAHYTAGSRFYIDFGILGFIALFAGLATLSFYIDITRRRSRDIFFPAIAAIAFLTVVYSSRELLTDSPSFVMTICWLLLARFYVELPVRRHRRKLRAAKAIKSLNSRAPSGAVI